LKKCIIAGLGGQVAQKRGAKTRPPEWGSFSGPS